MGKWTKAAELHKPFMDLGRLAAQAGITADSAPEDLPTQPGYKWEAKVETKKKKNKITWEAVEDPNAQGTSTNPFAWESGMKVYANYYYLHKDKLYLCVQTGTPDKINKKDYFEKVK